MMTVKRRSLAMGSVGLVLLAAAPSQAWEVAKPDTVDTRVRETPPRPFPFQMRLTTGQFTNPAGRTLFGRTDGIDSLFPQGGWRDYLASHSSNGFLRFEQRYIRDAIGGAPETAEKPYVAGHMLFCPTKPTGTDFAAYGCRMANSRDSASAGWMNERKRWVDNAPDDVEDEHAELTRQAATAAGLPAVLGETFWVRYPAPNGYVSSPSINPNTNKVEGWLVAPRWTPQDVQNVATSTLRPIRLYELAGMPDLALSVWDWAAGQELCPLDLSPGFPSVSDDPTNSRCHDYLATVGPLNATHFAPANRNVYEYYHGLALSSMQRCSTLKAALEPNHQYDDRNPGWAPTLSTKDTETHECEREALIYEMFAQHFMQDAWSTGHMWHRWGRTEPAYFDYYLKDAHGIHWDVPKDEIPQRNQAGRRAVIAGVTAGFVGMVHGAKAVARYAVPRKLRAVKYVGGALGDLGDLLVAIGITDDPLSAPFYWDMALEDFLPVTWRNAQNVTAQGIGDLFVGAVLQGGDPQFQEEADRLRMCTAKSLREVYDAGPHAHGDPSAFSGRWDMAAFDIGQQCWSQRATNASMVGAVLPVGLSYDSLSHLGRDVPKAVFGMANAAVVSTYEDATSWAMPDVPDRKRFFKSLADRMVIDELSVAEAYLDNAMTGPPGDYETYREPLGTQSAMGQRKTVYEDSTEIKFLDLPPNRPQFGIPPTKFMDPPEVLDSGDEIYDGAHDVTSQLLRRMFWRAHPEDTCEIPGLVNQLRDQCIAGADRPGGDPEACTRCTEVAELQMPTCGLWGSNIDFVPSKCTSLGYENAGGIDPIYYVPFTTASTASCFNTSTGLLPPLYSAFHYCTGTDPTSTAYASQLGDENSQFYGRRTVSSQTTGHFECADFEDWYNEHAIFGDIDILSPHDYGNSRTRFAYGLDENRVEGNSWLFPIVSALTEDVQVQLLDAHNICMNENPNAQSKVTSSLDNKLASLIDPLPLWDNEGGGLRNMVNDNWGPDHHQVHVEYCGVVQRATYANRDCLQVLPMLGKGLNEINQIGERQNTATGFEATTAIQGQERRCSVIEERYVKSACYDGTCDANGLCTSRDAPDIVFGR